MFILFSIGYKDFAYKHVSSPTIKDQLPLIIFDHLSGYLLYNLEEFRNNKSSIFNFLDIFRHSLIGNEIKQEIEFLKF